MDITISGHEYRTRKLNARQQLNVARRLASTPLQFLLQNAENSLMPTAIETTAAESGMTEQQITDFLPALMPSLSLRALGQLSEQDSDYIVNTCLSVIQRRSGHNGAQVWTAVMNPQSGAMQFQDIELKEMLELTLAVLRESLSSFFSLQQPASPPQPSTPPDLTG